MENFKTRCGGCGKSYRVPTQALGRSVRCKQCGHVFKAEPEVQVDQLPELPELPSLPGQAPSGRSGSERSGERPAMDLRALGPMLLLGGLALVALIVGVIVYSGGAGEAPAPVAAETMNTPVAPVAVEPAAPTRAVESPAAPMVEVATPKPAPAKPAPTSPTPAMAYLYDARFEQVGWAVRVGDDLLVSEDVWGATLVAATDLRGGVSFAFLEPISKDTDGIGAWYRIKNAPPGPSLTPGTIQQLTAMKQTPVLGGRLGEGDPRVDTAEIGPAMTLAGQTVIRMISAKEALQHGMVIDLEAGRWFGLLNQPPTPEGDRWCQPFRILDPPTGDRPAVASKPDAGPPPADATTLPSHTLPWKMSQMDACGGSTAILSESGTSLLVLDTANLTVKSKVKLDAAADHVLLSPPYVLAISDSRRQIDVFELASGTHLAAIASPMLSESKRTLCRSGVGRFIVDTGRTGWRLPMYPLDDGRAPQWELCDTSPSRITRGEEHFILLGRLTRDPAYLPTGRRPVYFAEKTIHVYTSNQPNQRAVKVPLTPELQFDPKPAARAVDVAARRLVWASSDMTIVHQSQFELPAGYVEPVDLYAYDMVQFGESWSMDLHGATGDDIHWADEPPPVRIESGRLVFTPDPVTPHSVQIKGEIRRGDTWLPLNQFVHVMVPEQCSLSWNDEMKTYAHHIVRDAEGRPWFSVARDLDSHREKGMPVRRWDQTTGKWELQTDMVWSHGRVIDGKAFVVSTFQFMIDDDGAGDNPFRQIGRLPDAMTNVMVWEAEGRVYLVSRQAEIGIVQADHPVAPKTWIRLQLANRQSRDSVLKPIDQLVASNLIWAVYSGRVHRVLPAVNAAPVPVLSSDVNAKRFYVGPRNQLFGVFGSGLFNDHIAVYDGLKGDKLAEFDKTTLNVGIQGQLYERVAMWHGKDYVVIAADEAGAHVYAISSQDFSVRRLYTLALPLLGSAFDGVRTFQVVGDALYIQLERHSIQLPLTAE